MGILGAWGMESQNIVRDKLLHVGGGGFYSYETSVLPSPGASEAALVWGSASDEFIGFLDSSPSGTDFWMHGQWYFQDNNTGNDEWRFGWMAGVELAGYISREDNTGRVTIIVDGSVVATSVAAVTLSVYTRIHVHVDYQNSGSGFVRVYDGGQVGGTPLVEFNGNTNPSGYGAIDSIQLRGSQTFLRADDILVMDPNDGVIPFDVDDIAFTTIGVRRVEADGTDSDWAAEPGAGADYEDIDEIPNDDADYIRATATSQASTFDFENATFGSVLAVKVKARTIRSGTNAGTNIAIRQRLGATVTDSADIPCPGDGDVHLILHEDADGNPWATLNYDNTEFGVVSKT